ncbi:MAG TPA: Ig-like domain-containing protein [Syntrophomonadaceae bacterium]|nr:Ig-like domain-containing protein [Syntrophomonadaceae bacterium]
MPAKRMFFYIMLLGLVLAFKPGPADAAPVESEWGTVVSAVYNNSTTDLNAAGFKGTVCDFTYMQVTFTDSGNNLAVALNPGHSLSEINLTGGGVDETAKFTPKLDNGILKLQLNTAFAHLKEGTLYKINIPAGIFADANGLTINKQLTISFVTLMQNPSRNDILVSASPAADTHGVSEKTQSIVFSFVDNITMASNISSYISFNNTPVISGADCDTVTNYDITAVGRQLVLTAKNGAALKDFVNYQITLAAGAVTLTGTSITNAEQTLKFSTDCMYSSVSPADGQTGVNLEPVITLTFKQPIEILDKAQISISGDVYTISADNISLADEKNLVIDLKDGGSCLKRNTCYTVTLGAGAVRFKQSLLENRNIVIKFTTTAAGQPSIITAYSSDAAGTDNICTAAGTKLTPDGSIYIHFDRAIAWDRECSDPLPEAELNILYPPTSYAYDPNGWSFDQEYIYNGSGGKEKEIPIKSISICDTNAICVKPLYPLQNLNCYHFNLSRRVVDDLYGCNTGKDIDFTFWTVPGSNTVAPAWDGIDGLTSEQVITGSAQGTKTYTATGTPVYTGTTPLTLKADSEVIVKAGDTGALQRIKLTLKGQTDLINITPFKLDYYYDEKVKTKISLYPIDPLQTGQEYCLVIPGDVFETRSGVFLPALTVYFTPGDPGNPVLSVYSVEPASLSTVDIAKGQTFFLIKGFNLNESIQKVELTPTSGSGLELGPLEIEKDDLYLIDPNTLKVMLRNNKAAWLGREEATGIYRASLWYDDGGTQTEAAAVGEASLQILSRGVPAVLSYYPAAGSQNDEKNLLPQSINGTTRYFLSVKWQDPDGTLGFNLAGDGLNLLKTSTVYSEGGSQVSMIDTDFITWIQNLTDEAERSRCIQTYLYNASTDILYIPIKLLRPQTTYTVTLNEDIVKFTGGEGNAVITWSFSTVSVPSVMTVTPGSVVEDYPAGTYVTIQGSFFSGTGVIVKFNDQTAAKVETLTVNGKTFLKAFLPQTSRLTSGVYNVTVINDSNHQQILYSAFSVIKESDTAPPVDGQRTRSEGRLGTVVEQVKTSETVLQLDNDYRDRNHLKIDLDELMGDKVLTRTIEFDGRRGERINELETLSRWADITLYGLTLDSVKSKDDITVRLARVDTARSSWLGSKLRGRVRLSDYIEVGGKNFRVDQIMINMPFSLSEGDNLKVLRYDDTLRNWLEVPFTVNRLERKVLLTSTRPGIFVVVE